jgi:3-oxoacyl-[acyl-carrier-protein] synthase II
MDTRRVVITGMGLVSPLGCALKPFWDRIRSGASGIRRISRFDPSGYATQIAAEVVEFDLNAYVPRKEQKRMDPYSHYAMAAAKLAVADSGVDMSREDARRVGVIVGSGIGGLHTLEAQHSVLIQKGPDRCSPFMIPQMICNMAGGLIAIEYGMKGPNYAVVSACATAAHCMGDAMILIQRGNADVMVAGGSEAAVTPLGIAGFCALRALSTRNDDPQKASRPFDAGRDGFVMGEGSGVLVLEELEHAKKRGARIYCELAGYGVSCDAFHMTAPDDAGEGAARSMKLAIENARLTPGDIDYVNAHGTSTELNDRCETAAIKAALGEARARQIMVSSTKSMHGHLLGAAGGVESIVCALAIQHQVAPPTTNYETPDPSCDLDYVPNTARPARIRACLNNSFGFGGHNATLVLKELA